jgi:hypothetical protein
VSKTNEPAGRITKLTIRSSKTTWNLGIKERRHFSRVCYFVKFPSGTEYSCDNRAQALILVNDEPAVLAFIAAMNDRLSGKVAS